MRGNRSFFMVVTIASYINILIKNSYLLTRQWVAIFNKYNYSVKVNNSKEIIDLMEVLTMQVKDFMIKDVIYVTPDTTMKELLQLLTVNKIGGAPVIDTAGKLLGMITDGDVIRYLQPRGRTVYDLYAHVMIDKIQNLQQNIDAALSKPVTELMRKKQISTVQPESDLEEAVKIFSAHAFKKIPVVTDEQIVIGVISRGDVIRYIASRLVEKTKDNSL